MDQKADDLAHQHGRTTAVGGATVDAPRSGASTAGGNTGSSQRLEQIRASIENTEAELVKTLDAIQVKLSPDHLGDLAGGMIQEAVFRRIEEMMNRLSEASGKIGHSTVDTIKHNPLPSVLLGLGLGWFLIGNLRGRSDQDEQTGMAYPGMSEDDTEALYNAGLEEPGGSEYQQGGSQATHSRVSGVVHKAKEKAGSVQERAGKAAVQIKERAKHLTESVKHGRQSTRGGVTRIVEERPLASGLAALGIGAIVGLLAAGAFRSGFLSDTRENLKHKAQELVHDTKEKASRIVEHAGKAAREEAERQHLITH